MRQRGTHFHPGTNVGVGKDHTLRRIADTLMSRAASILVINAEEVERAREAGMAEHMIDRLTLTEERVTAMVQAAEAIRV